MQQGQKDPTIALLCILDKRDQIIMLKNYLCDLNIVQPGSAQEKQLDFLRAQMKMMVLQSLDLIDEQYGKIKTESHHSKISDTKQYNDQCFLGCLFESHVDEYEMDVFAYISLTRYKYILIKNDQHQLQRNLGCIGTSSTGQSLNQNQINAQIAMIQQAQQFENVEVKKVLQDIHRMHCEVLLNPFYQAQYIQEDDGQDFTVFTQLQDQEKQINESNKNEIDAVEDLILDDFSLDDNDSDSQGSRSSVASIEEAMLSDRSRSSSIQMCTRQKGKQILLSHTNGCLETLNIKIDQMVMQYEDRYNTIQLSYHTKFPSIY